MSASHLVTTRHCDVRYRQVVRRGVTRLIIAICGCPKLKVGRSSMLTQGPAASVACSPSRSAMIRPTSPAVAVVAGPAKTTAPRSRIVLHAAGQDLSGMFDAPVHSNRAGPAHDGRANAASHLPAGNARLRSRLDESLAHPHVRLATRFLSFRGGSLRLGSLIAHLPPGGGWLLQRRSKLVDFRKGPRESAASSCRALGTSR